MVVLVLGVLHVLHVVPLVFFWVVRIKVVLGHLVVVSQLTFLVLLVHLLVVLLVAISVVSGRHSAALVGVEVGLGPVHIILVVGSLVLSFVVFVIEPCLVALVVAAELVVLVTVLLHVLAALPPVLVLATSVIVVAVLVGVRITAVRIVV